MLALFIDLGLIASTCALTCAVWQLTRVLQSMKPVAKETPCSSGL